MAFPNTSTPDLRSSFTTWLLGFFGVTALFLLLPKTIKFLVRRFLLGLVSEIVAVVITGLLAEKAVEKLGSGE